MFLIISFVSELNSFLVFLASDAEKQKLKLG